jgi:hypothetical protein
MTTSWKSESVKISCSEIKLSRMNKTTQISLNCVKIRLYCPWCACHGCHSGSWAIMCCHRIKLVSGILVMRCTCGMSARVRPMDVRKVLITFSPTRRPFPCSSSDGQALGSCRPCVIGFS